MGVVIRSVGGVTLRIILCVYIRVSRTAYCDTRGACLCVDMPCTTIVNAATRGGSLGTCPRGCAVVHGCGCGDHLCVDGGCLRRCDGKRRLRCVQELTKCRGGGSMA